MEIVHYFEPYKYTPREIPGFLPEDALGGQVSFFNGKENWFMNFKYDVVIIGVPESRNGADNLMCSSSPDQIRQWLYSLRSFGSALRIADAGNIRGSSLNDRYQALREVTEYIVDSGAVMVVLGGTQDLTVPVYQGLLKFKPGISLAVADSMADVEVNVEDFSSRSWLSHLINTSDAEPEELVLFGVQKYLMAPSQEALFEEKYYDVLRLGDIRGGGVDQTEVILRDSHFFSMDYRVLKDQPQFHQDIISPHGLEPHEVCRIWRYAGFSDQMKVAGLFEVPEESSGIMNHYLLGGEMIWHFLDGICGRENDYPMRSADEYQMQIVTFDGLEEGLTFYRNTQNNRWWMEVPSPEGYKIMACRREDYRSALKNEFPDKWWRFFLKNADKQ